MKSIQMRKTILITGASSGIGRACAIYFQQQGWQVAATMRQPEKETELTRLANVKLYQLDVQDTMSINTAIAQAIKDFGIINVVLNNAGYGARGAFEASTREQFVRQFDVNVFGIMSVTQALLPHFRENKTGIIINISSILGRTSFPFYSLYHASKWAVEGFTEGLRYELEGFGIRVKLVEPGATVTEFLGRSEDLLKKDNLKVYDADFAKLEKASEPFLNKSSKPIDIAKVVYKAATDSSSRLRYLAGTDAKIFAFTRRLLGYRMHRYIIRIFFGL
jgi:NAD(P)-dependent dehydrogenase (short-subunit alcohol dehydrogenase family)